MGIVNPRQLKQLVAKGFSDEEIATFYAVDRVTIHRWRKANPEICNAVKEGRVLADEKVEVSLYESACGYSHKEDKIFCQEGHVTVVPTIKRYAPDTVAAMFWLCNRQKDKWRHVNRVEHTGADGLPIEVKNHLDLKEWTPEELKRAALQSDGK